MDIKCVIGNPGAWCRQVNSTAIHTYSTQHDPRFLKHEGVVITVNSIAAVDWVFAIGNHVLGDQSVSAPNFDDFSKWLSLPPHWIGDRVTEYFEEGGLDESVEVSEGLMARGSQSVRRIQNPRNPLLLGEGRKGDLGFLQKLVVSAVPCRGNIDGLQRIVEVLRVALDLGHQHLCPVGSHCEFKVHVFDRPRMVAEDNDRQIYATDARPVVHETGDENLTLVYYRECSLLEELRLRSLDIPGRCILEYVNKRQFLKTHPSLPSNSTRPSAISASSFASRFRITFGGSYSTASYSTSL